MASTSEIAPGAKRETIRSKANEIEKVRTISQPPAIVKRLIKENHPPCKKIASKGVQGFLTDQPILCRHPEKNVMSLARITGDLSNNHYKDLRNILVNEHEAFMA